MYLHGNIPHRHSELLSYKVCIHYVCAYVVLLHEIIMCLHICTCSSYTHVHVRHAHMPMFVMHISHVYHAHNQAPYVCVQQWSVHCQYNIICMYLPYY